MAKSKKFGTFSGVFTPSLLTILGVIMYLRLPWIVGQSGLLYTIAIIVIAHIVSVTTGLSVASIATDKKVEAGGNYYIISRSLGLPIGGTLGIALFVGLSFSVSLYVIGFCENLLSVLDIPIGLDSIRLYGSAALLAITVIIFISTSLAIKTQYFILAAVLLSIVSIFLGGSALPAEQISIKPIDNGESLFIIFGIFFPAVTGFTAGVQMSGDLKDPKKSIPFGTITAISFGFVVYLALAVFIAYYIPRDQLLVNQNILMDMAWNPQLVIAGIWGATLSSAMGSILGAPRILQASSRDNVTPKVFAKGTGKSNEPRRALLLTFIIAETGILIGDLNIIARIVSIFFISTYGLINLSYTLESWASTDFRPTFKVPVWVGIIGTLACGIIMFELDVVAFIGAILVLTIIYLFLKRKELALDTGDTWGSFWASIVRTGLYKLNESFIHKRNWSPNILLFRGSGESRPHLLNLSKWLSGKTGIISDFELIETDKGHLTFSKAAQQVKMENENTPGIFHRRYECENIYAGIESVSRFYGFSGVEPNTLLFGWPKNTMHPQRVISMLQNLITLDYNVLLLNQPEDNTFGTFKTIDVWWRGGSNNAALALSLLRFLNATDKWNDAKVRILIIIDDGALVNKVHSNMLNLLQNLRQDAQVKIINNSIEKRNFNEIMKTESGQTDLTLIGLPDPAHDADFIKKTTRFVKDLNTVLFIKASSFFEPYYIGIERTIEAHVKSNLEKVKFEHAKIELPKDEIFAKRILGIHNDINNSINEFYRSYIVEIEQDLKSLGKELNELAINSFKTLTKNLESVNPELLVKIITRIRREIFLTSQKALERFENEKLEILSNSLTQGIENLFLVHDGILLNCPESEYVYFSIDEVTVEKGDPFFTKLFKVKKKVGGKIFKWTLKVPVKLKNFIRDHIYGFLRKHLAQHIKQIGVIGYSSVSELQNIFNRIHDIIKNMETTSHNEGKISASKINESIKTINELFNAYSLNIETSFARIVNGFSAAHHQSFQNKLKYFDKIEVNRIIKKQFRIKKESIETEKFLNMPLQWKRNMVWVVDFTDMELSLILLKSRLSRLLNRWLQNTEKMIDEKLSTYFEPIEKVFYSFINSQKMDDVKKLIVQEENETVLPNIQTRELSSEIQKLIKELPEMVEVMSEGSYKSLEEHQFEELDVVSVYLNRLVGYLVDTEFMQDLSEEVDSFNLAIKESIAAIQDTQRLVTSGINNTQEIQESGELLDDEEDLDHLIGHGLRRLSQSKEKISLLIANLKDYVNINLQSAFDQMNPYLITQSTGNLKQYIFSHEQRRVLGKIGFLREKIVSLFQALIAAIQYTQSEGILFARKLNRLDDVEESVMDKLISFTQKFSPPVKEYITVPRYYKQLFLSENPISSQFMIPQENVIRHAEKIYQRYKEGYNGALLIKGEPRSGKSSLSRFLAQKFFKKENMYRLNPKPGGSVNSQTFTSYINESLRHSGTIDQVFNTLPHKSVLIINNLEMWWQRNEDGFTIINILLNLIDKYSSKVFFIVNMNNHAYRLINKIQNIEKSFLGIVNVDPLSAKDIEKAILLRHRSTGIQFEFNERLENNLSEIRKARLFNSIFKYSNGSIGVALQTWLSMIKGYTDDIIRIQKLPAVGLAVLNNLEDEWVVWLTEFILHRELTIKRLSDIFPIPEIEILPMVEALTRSGFVVKTSNNILKINPFIEHHLINHFCQIGTLWNN